MSDSATYVIRHFKNVTGSPFRFPFQPHSVVDVESGQEVDIVTLSDQAIPQGFEQIGKDVKCDENGVADDKPVEKGKSETVAVSDAKTATAPKA